MDSKQLQALPEKWRTLGSQAAIKGKMGRCAAYEDCADELAEALLAAQGAQERDPVTGGVITKSGEGWFKVESAAVKLFDLVAATREKLRPYLRIETFPTGKQPANYLAVDVILQEAFESAAPPVQGAGTPPLDEPDNYVAWCRYTTGPIITCDSDAIGAFRVYRWPASKIRDLEGQIKQLNLLYMNALDKLTPATEVPIAYACPAGCGCIWRDNHDDGKPIPGGTMSLFGKNSKSCEVCEPLPLAKMIPLYRAAHQSPVEALREAREYNESVNVCHCRIISGTGEYCWNCNELALRLRRRALAAQEKPPAQRGDSLCEQGDHYFENGKCTACGSPAQPSEGGDVANVKTDS